MLKGSKNKEEELLFCSNHDWLMGDTYLPLELIKTVEPREKSVFLLHVTAPRACAVEAKQTMAS